MYSFAIVVAALAAAPSQNKPTKYVLKTEDAKSIVGTVTYDVTSEKAQANEWVVFAAVAPELPGQTKVKTVLSPAGTTAADLSPFARKMLVAHVKVNTATLKASLPIKITYSATLRSRTLVVLNDGDAAPAVAPLPEKERKLFLTNFGDCDYSNATFKKWVKVEGLARGASEAEVDYARRVFLAIKAKFRYEFKLDLDRHASTVCAAGKSDCGGLATLFVAALRAHGVPARTLYGRWAESAKTEDTLNGTKYLQWHVKAEFFAAGVGWVPVDISGAIQHDKTRAGLEYFGRDKGDFLTFHIDANVTLDSKISGKQVLQSLQRPAYWVRGNGAFEPHTDVEDWRVR